MHHPGGVAVGERVGHVRDEPAHDLDPGTLERGLRRFDGVPLLHARRAQGTGEVVTGQVLEGRGLVAQPLEHRGQGRAAHELEREVGSTLRLTHVEDAHDVRVVEARDRTRLALKALPRARVGGRRQHLERDLPAVSIPRAMDDAHAAGAEATEEAIRTEPLGPLLTHQTQPRELRQPRAQSLRVLRVQRELRLERRLPAVGLGLQATGEELLEVVGSGFVGHVVDRASGAPDPW